MTGGAAYLTWNDSRRSASLAALLRLERVLMVADRRGALRHALGFGAAVAWLVRHRPATVWYQFSLLLGVAVGLYRCTLGRGSRVIADIHTKALRRDGGRVRWLILPVKRWALRQCDGCLVTNPENAGYARSVLRVDARVLRDPLPSVPVRATKSSAHSAVVFVCSFAPDEPIDLITDVARRLQGEVEVLVTGDPSRLPASLRSELGRVCRLTGFLSDENYWELLRGARGIVVLSDQPACLPCGAYEAIALGHRPIIADDPVGRAAFGECAVYATLEAEAVVRAIRSVGCAARPNTVARAYRRRWARHWASIQMSLGLTPLAR